MFTAIIIYFFKFYSFSCNFFILFYFLFLFFCFCFSPKFSRKLCYVTRLEDLAEYVHLDQIDVPVQVAE